MSQLQGSSPFPNLGRTSQTQIRGEQKPYIFSPETEKEFFEIAMQFLEDKKARDAADAFFFLASLKPENEEIWLRLGNAEQLCERYEEAIFAYEVAALVSVKDPFPYLYASLAYLKMNQQADAVAALNEALRISQETADYSYITRLIEARIEEIL
jgi:tetratricopeptide (TPR) repeat protein